MSKANLQIFLEKIVPILGLMWVLGIFLVSVDIWGVGQDLQM